MKTYEWQNSQVFAVSLKSFTGTESMNLRSVGHHNKTRKARSLFETQSRDAASKPNLLSIAKASTCANEEPHHHYHYLETHAW